MSNVRVRIEGQTWITLEAICECYDCEIAWVREVYDLGLLGGGRMHADTVVLRVTVLDRVARVVRLSRYEGLGFEAIALLLGEPDEDPAGDEADRR